LFTGKRDSARFAVEVVGDALAPAALPCLHRSQAVTQGPFSLPGGTVGQVREGKALPGVLEAILHAHQGMKLSAPRAKTGKHSNLKTILCSIWSSVRMMNVEMVLGLSLGCPNRATREAPWCYQFV